MAQIQITHSLINISTFLFILTIFSSVSSMFLYFVVDCVLVFQKFTHMPVFCARMYKFRVNVRCVDHLIFYYVNNAKCL